MRSRHQAYADAVAAATRAHARSTDVSPDLAAFADKIADRAADITDADVEALKRAGHSDDRIFEVAVRTALDAALSRIATGMAALGGTTT